MIVDCHIWSWWTICGQNNYFGVKTMRITDGRYDRDRLRLSVAFRLINFEARTRTIRDATQLSDDRIRKLYRDYVKSEPGTRIRRRRGKSPRQMSFFRRSPEHELQAATLGSMMRSCGLLAKRSPPQALSLIEVDRLCDVYASHRELCSTRLISFEHAWYLRQVLARNDEWVLTRCRDCRCLWIRDMLDLLPEVCVVCRRDISMR